jgi:hypothetical protein
VGPNHKTKGLKGQSASPTPWLADNTLSWFRPRIGGYIHTSVHKSILCLRVSGNREEWPASHVDGCPAIHHLQTDSIKSVEAPLYLYIRILMTEFTHTTLLYFSTCKGSDLIVEAQSKPWWELRVESSLRSSSGSTLGAQ